MMRDFEELLDPMIPITLIMMICTKETLISSKTPETPQPLTLNLYELIFCLGQEEDDSAETGCELSADQEFEGVWGF